MPLRVRRIALAAVLGLGACAARETQSSRAAWQRAVQQGGPGRSGDATPSGRGGGGHTTADPSAWRDLADFTTSTADLLSLGTSTVPLKSLVTRLCAEPPEETRVDPEAVRCPPKPAMEPLGHPLTLELGRGGMVGLVAVDLSDRDSADLVQQGLKYMAGSCAKGWTQIPSRADNAHEEFHTCTARSGSMLVLGRFPIDLAGGRWQFSLAVLGPG